MAAAGIADSREATAIQIPAEVLFAASYVRHMRFAVCAAEGAACAVDRCIIKNFESESPFESGKELSSG